ncbi:MAG TPA: AIM24 family protein [Pseudonocardiaceae bacterium]|nr:AIM24 family protein [Pseudonocardiaceae bacterium]
MKVDLRHNPSFTVARCYLAPGGSVLVEGGATITHSAGVLLESKTQGGIVEGLSRNLLGGGRCRW